MTRKDLLTKTLESVLFQRSIITYNDYGCFRKNFLEKKNIQVHINTIQYCKFKNNQQKRKRCQEILGIIPLAKKGKVGKFLISFLTKNTTVHVSPS